PPPAIASAAKQPSGSEAWMALAAFASRNDELACGDSLNPNRTRFDALVERPVERHEGVACRIVEVEGVTDRGWIEALSLLITLGVLERGGCWQGLGGPQEFRSRIVGQPLQEMRA